MKYILASLAVLLFSIGFAQKNTFKLLDSKYYYNSSESKTYYMRLVSLNGVTYFAKGAISFDNDGRTIQELGKFKKNVKSLTINKPDYTPMLKEFDKMAFIQFIKAKGNEENIRKIVAHLDNELTLSNAATNNYLNFDNGVANVEYFIKNSDLAFQKIFDVLKNEGAIDEVLIGHRVYMDGDDFNIEIIYPFDYEGTFWGF